MIDVLASTRTVGRQEQEMPVEAIRTYIPARLRVFPGRQAGVDRLDGFSLDPGCLIISPGLPHGFPLSMPLFKVGR